MQKLQSASVETDEMTEERLDCHNISNFEQVALKTPTIEWSQWMIGH